jgi:hypothetical protein
MLWWIISILPWIPLVILFKLSRRRKKKKKNIKKIDAK